MVLSLVILQFGLVELHFFDQGTQLNFGAKLGKYPFYSKYCNGIMTGNFVLKVLVILNIVPKSVDTCREPAIFY